jgi:membrane protein
MSVKDIFELIKTTCLRWWEDNTFRLGAALAFYTVFSLAPLVLLTIAVGGLVFSKEAVRRQMSDELSQLAGPSVASAFQETTSAISKSGSGLLATAVSIVLLVIGATTVFGQLQDALNTIWGVKTRPEGTILAYIKDQFWSFAMVVSIGFLLLVSLVLSAILAALSRWLEPSSLPGGVVVWQVLHWLVSLGLVTLLFALIYKVLPAVELGWRDVWVGAAVTAILFNIGTYLIGLYLGRSTLVSAYGAAGSLVVILMWVYYSSQILLLGAEFTYVYATWTGKPLVPAKNAEAITEESRAREGRPRQLPGGTIQDHSQQTVGTGGA